MILKMNINMTDITEKTENGELVTNRDQLVVVDNIESLIKVIRELQVMLDKDLATLYGVETRTLNQAVKRNIQRSLSDFRLQFIRAPILTGHECYIITNKLINNEKISNFYNGFYNYKL